MKHQDIIPNQEQITKTQVSKQADVMEDLFPRKVKLASWDYYEPWCLHDSSLSLSTHSVLASDIGDPELGCQMFRKACLIDLDNVNPHSSDAGIHAAPYGGLWQCVVYGSGGPADAGRQTEDQPQYAQGVEQTAVYHLVERPEAGGHRHVRQRGDLQRDRFRPVTVEVWNISYTFTDKLAVSQDK